MKTIKTAIRFLLGLILLIAFFKVMQAVFFDPITTTFNVTVNTERIEYKTLDKNNSRLILYDAEITGVDSIVFEKFNGTIDLNVNTNVIIERIASGPIIITMENQSEKSIGKLYNGDDGELIYTGGDFLEVYVDNLDKKIRQGRTFIFNIDGDIKLGRSVNLEIFDESTALLRGGQVKMIGNSEFSNNYFEAGTRELNLGDRLIFDEIQYKAFGFVTINENPGMSAAYRVISKEARVIKPGPQNEESGYRISASLLDRFLKDRFFQAISLVFAALLAIMSVLTFFMDSIQFYQDLKSKNETN